MPEYTYQALDKGGKEVRGVIDAGSEEAIVGRLRGMGYYPLSVTISRRRAADTDLLAAPGLRLVFHRIRRTHVVTFTRQLATLIGAGLPLTRALRILQEQVESALFKDKIQAIATDIDNGGTLSDALAKHPRQFDSLYVNMVRAGEAGGVLETVLDKIAHFLERRHSLAGKVRSALMYPLVVVTLAAAIVGFILVTIIPKFRDIFDQLGAELPATTQFLVDASYTLVHRSGWVALAVAATWYLLHRVNGTREGRYLFDRVKLKLPVFGELLRKAAIGRFATTLSTLITSGVPILQALDIVRETSGNAVVGRAMHEVYLSVRDGATIHEPLSKCAVFPPLVVHMVAVGEETGAVDQMLGKVAEAYEREVDDTVNALTSIIEPVLIVFLGATIGFVVVALYLPIISIPVHVGKDA
jgi:type IV pilus assembly protein PilC